MSFKNIVLYSMATIGFMFLFVGCVTTQTEHGEYRVFRPEGPGPHPAVVFVSGCSGFRPDFAPNAYEKPAEELRKMGFVVVWADVLGRRYLRSCTSGGITQEEAARDAVEAASWLRSQPYVNAQRIAAIGWSYGGGAILAALANHSVDKLIFTKAIVYYPYCMGEESWAHRVPVLVLRGDSDNVTSQHHCKSALETSSEKGDVKVINYTGAQHCFDFSELPPSIEYQFGTIGYHPQAAAAAWEEVRRFLQPTK